jgi:lipopolysaccharide/colanic/teichoic acid biosynthesis glycosyltransferase
MRTSSVKPYYSILRQKKAALFAKRAFDLAASAVLILALSPAMALAAIAVKLTSPGPVLYRQVRRTAYLKEFEIIKFRTMADGADKKGPLVTVHSDSRITPAGKFLRSKRIDEMPQLFNILKGDMSFVGARPEVEKFIAHYDNEMLATFLLPAGLTSESSIVFMDEEKILNSAVDPEQAYIYEVLPKKMQLNLEYIRTYSFFGDIGILARTLFAVFAKKR